MIKAISSAHDAAKANASRLHQWPGPRGPLASSQQLLQRVAAASLWQALYLSWTLAQLLVLHVEGREASTAHTTHAATAETPLHATVTGPPHAHHDNIYT